MCIRLNITLVEIKLEEKDNFDCLVKGKITLGEEKFEQDTKIEKTFFILLFGIWPNI